MDKTKDNYMEEEFDDIEFVDDILQENVIPNVSEKVRVISFLLAILTSSSFIIALAMFVIGIITIIKIGWLIGLFMIFCSLFAVIIILLVSQATELVLYNNMFLDVIYDNVRGFFDNIKIVDVKKRGIKK